MQTTHIFRALAALPAFAAATVALAGGPGGFDIETILADGMWNNPTSTAIDEDGTIHVAYMTQFSTVSDTKEIFYAWKPAAPAPGGEWSFSQITDNDVREEFPCIALDHEGNVHIAFHTGVPGGTNKIRYVNNVGQPAGSGTFNPIVDITDNGFSITRVAVDSQGVAHLAFRTHNSATTLQQINYRTYDPATGTLGPLVNVSLNSQDNFGANIAIDADDGVHVVWQRGGVLSGALAYHSKPAGGNFSEQATGVIGNIIDPKIVIDDDGRISIFYRPGLDALNYVEKLPGAGSFSAPMPVYTGTYRSAFIERIAADINGRRYVAFASNIAANRGTFFVEEIDDNVWAEPLKLAGEDGGNQGTSVAINTSGELVVTWSISGFDGIVFADMFAARKDIDLNGDVPCPGDLTRSGSVGVADLLSLLACWGPVDPGSDCAAADLTDDGSVGVADLLALLANWGACP